MAKITVIGANIGRDAESRQVGDHYIVEFPIADNTKAGGKEITSWFRVKVWNNYAKALERDLIKGARISVSGRLVIDEWTDRDGNKRTTPEISADAIHIERGAEGRPARPKPEEKPGEPEPDDDIPF